ncbi:hypothetical protein [Aureimonas sp. AU12]|uniref:hypothetical protein n=1 Tax=Aureimonas sp. AU12 TaxID=1638161 RepID=UPI0012E35433|nr:hypothetical protein [Aureimonas sp. AU12]
MNEVAGRPKFDGRMVFLPRVDALHPGDILLTSNVESDDRKGLISSSMIRAATKGNFSHALICSHPPTFVEAIGSGVSTLSLARCFAYDIGNIRLLRYPDALIAETAARIAMDEVGRDYSVARAVRSVFPTQMLDRIDDHGIFCSALVAQAFTVAGGDLFRPVSPDQTTPATIERMAGLTDITASAFHRALAPRNIEQMSSLDGDRVPTPSSRQTSLSAEYARSIWPKAEALVKDYPELGLEPGATLYGMLRFITDSIDHVRRVRPGGRDAFLQRLMTIDQELAALIGKGELETVLADIEAIDDPSLMKNMQESFSSKPDIDLDALQAYLTTARRGLEVRQDAISNWEGWGLERSKSMTTYIEIDRKVAASMTLRNTAIEEILARCRPLTRYGSAGE